VAAVIRVFSYGGGVQSTAALVLAAQGRIDYRTFVFANVGEDSENPDTLAYVENYAKPYALEHGLELIEVWRQRKDGTRVNLYEYAMTSNTTIPIPAYLQSGAPGKRVCTVEWKVNIVAKYIKQLGATKDKPAVVGLGISLDEFQRARTNSRIAWELLEYPLLDLRLTRQDCKRIIAEAGWPVPPKSSCFFCPFHKKDDWLTLRRERPDLFGKAVQLEERINELREQLGKDKVYLHRSLKPISQVIGLQASLFDMNDDELCDSGYCFL
jgi:hypothetical protein